MPKITFLIIWLVVISSVANSKDLNIKGYGSIVATSLLSDEGYWVKNPSGAGLYNDDVDVEIEEESLLGFQVLYSPNDKIKIVAEAIARGQNKFSLELESYYADFVLNSSFTSKIGRFRNPIYLYSDVMDVHYAFGWLRTPGSSYSLSASAIDGLSVSYLGSLGSVTNRTIVYLGRSRKDPDPFLTELFVNRGFTTRFANNNQDSEGNYYPMVEHKNDIRNAGGITTEFYYGSLTVHLAFMEASGEEDVKTYSDGSIFIEDYDDRDFYDVALGYNNGNWLAYSEYNRYVDVYSSYYVTLGKYINEWQVLLTYGEFDGEVVTASGITLPPSSQEQTQTTSLSVRYDFAPKVALKAELISFSNEGSLIVEDQDGDGEIDSTVLSFAIDFVF